MYWPPSHALRQKLALFRQLNENREPCEYDFMRTVPSWHRHDMFRRRCRLCGEPVPKGRQTTCGQECAKWSEILAFTDSMLTYCAERDGQKCPDCGKPRTEEYEHVLHTHRPGMTETRTRVLWHGELHHRRPVYKGGGQLGPDNLVTICHDCHAAETRKQAAERAAERRALLEPPEPSRQLEMAL